MLTVAIAGCTGYRTSRDGQLAEAEGDWDQAVLYYLEVLSDDPGDVRARADLLRAKIKASQMHFEKGQSFYRAGVLQQASVEYQQAVQLDPTNQYAQVELGKAREELRAAEEDRDFIYSIDDLKKKSANQRPQPPVLNPRSSEPISVDFPEPVSVFDIYQALGKAFGINVMYDNALKEEDLSITLREVTAEKALEHVMRAAKHFYKVLDEQTIIVAADTPQNRRIYEDQIIQTFFLSNADVKETMTMLRSLVGAKNIAANDSLNAIVLRDTVDKVKVAERIIEANDKARGEVVIDVELIQVESNKLRQLGLSLSQNQITQNLDLGGEDASLRISDLRFLNQNNWVLTIPSFIYDFVKNGSDAELLARPQVRISDGESANLTIGDRVPIPVTSFNTAQTVGSNVVPITSFQYTDVGISIEMEPRIHHNQEVTLKLRIEVSNLAGFVSGSGTEQQPIIGTRSFESTIRLKDGETNLLAGLIRSEDRSSLSGVPGISEVPILGRLFSRNETNNQRTDVVLTLTPHIVRTADITQADLTPIWVGTEANITFSGSPRVESNSPGPFDDDDEDAEEIREMLQRRIENLPRGLREAFDEAGEDSEDGAEANPGVDLVNPGQPVNIFGRDNDDDGGTRNFVYTGEGDGLRTTDEPGGPPPSPPELQGVRISLVPSNIRPAPGESFDVSVFVEAAVGVSHLPITLEYDPEILEVLAVDRGSFFGQSSESSVLSDVSLPGTIVLGASRLGTAGPITGGGLLATLRCRAKAEGSATLLFTKGKALDRRLQPIDPVDARSLTLAVGESTLVLPERGERSGRREAREE